MYLFELLVNAFRKKNNNKDVYNPMNIDEDFSEPDSKECEHLFLPLDSSNEYFACKYCGLVVPREKLKNKNIFENKSF